MPKVLLVTDTDARRMRNNVSVSTPVFFCVWSIRSEALERVSISRFALIFRSSVGLASPMKRRRVLEMPLSTLNQFVWWLSS